MHLTKNYTKHPNISIREQLREFVRRNPGCSGSEARKGIAKAPHCAKFLVTDVSVALNSMAASGILVRDKQKCASFYSINPRRFNRNGRFLAKTGWGESAQKEALRNYRLIRNGVKKYSADIRDDVLAEAYLRISDGLFNGSVEDVLEQAKFHVQKEYRGGWRENYTVDGALNDDGFTRLEVMTNEDEIIDGRSLYILERRIDQINRLERDGFEPDQYSHLWYTGGTTWEHRSNG